jgi:hypothetical protein
MRNEIEAIMSNKPVFCRIRKIGAHSAMSAIHDGRIYIRLKGRGFISVEDKPGIADYVASQVKYNKDHYFYLKSSS